MYKFDDIIPPSRRREMESQPAPVTSDLPSRPMTSDMPGGRSRFPLTTVIVVATIIVVSIAALFYFSSAKVEITPNTATAAVKSSFTASQSGPLTFQIINLQKLATKSVPMTGTKQVSNYASGLITVYNTSGKSVHLIARTRFSTPAGLIYRVRSAFTVPGGTSSSPGSIRVKVYADQPGSTYNIGSTSFTVPGLAGGPLASAVYARSAGPIAGGESGTVPVVDPNVATQTVTELELALSKGLVSSLQQKVPSGYVFLKGAATSTFEVLTPSTSSASGQANIRVQGNAMAVVFPNEALAGVIASSTPGLGYQGEPITLAPDSNLTLTSAADFPTQDTKSFPFTVTGNASLVYKVNPARITSAIAGKTRSQAETALSNYPEVKSALIILRPFWRQSFPQDPAAITVTVTNK